MKKTVAVILCIVVVTAAVLFCIFKKDIFGESDKFSSDANTESGILSELDTPEYFIGTWEVYIDFTDALTEAIAADDELGKYFDYENFGYTLFFSFEEDGTYSVLCDRDAFEEVYGKALEETKIGLTEFFTELLREQSTYSMTVNEYVEKAYQMTLDELCLELLSRDTYFSLMEQFELGGVYEAKSGRLYTSVGTDPIAESEYALYEIISKDEFKVTESTEAEDGYFELYPLIYKRVR